MRFVFFLFFKSNTFTCTDRDKLGYGTKLNGTTILLFMTIWNVKRVLYLEKGLISFLSWYLSVIWQDELEAMHHKSHCKYNTDKNVNPDTLKPNNKWLDNLISF